MLKVTFQTLALCVLLQSFASAKLIMPVIFGDGMVLQRDTAVTLFGQASEGASITVRFNGTEQKARAHHGRWKLVLDAMPAGGPYELIVSGDGEEIIYEDVMLGEVWLAGGQSNMAFHMGGLRDVQKRLPTKANPQVRFIKIPVTEFGDINRNGLRWKIADKESVHGFSAVAYFFAAELQKRLGVTVGIIGSYRGATWNENWMTPESIRRTPELRYLFEKYDKEYGVFEDEGAYEAAYKQYLVDLEDWKKKGGWSHGMVPFAPTGPKAYQRPSGLYECMIKPLQPYTIKGVIWYQGEGNSGRYEEFRSLFPAFVEGWRRTWQNPDLPFYFVQLPPYKDASWPHFRQAQLDCSKVIPNCGMVVSEGCGDLEDIHPKVKKPIGDRLAIAVSAEVYGHNHEPYGPVFESVEFRDAQAELRFRYAEGGLKLSADPDGSFEIAGADQAFVRADVELKGAALLLCNVSVKHPAYVRYAYSPYPNMVLFNQAGLPASPFTTEKSD